VIVGSTATAFAKSIAIRIKTTRLAITLAGVY
jgi:Trk-type K+ transport system membrane component